MKKRLALCTLILLLCTYAPACTNLIVGKKASKDGSVMCTYNCDGFGWSGSLSYSSPGKHQPGEMVPLNRWGTASDSAFVKQVSYTYNVVGLMNEHQVTIVETTFDGRLELVNPEGLLDYYSLMKLALERSKTAREAIQCMTNLVAEYGYNSSGETITICDKDEAWIMEIIGKGPSRKGAVWVALRIPDDCICAHANLSRIRQFPLHDKKNCLYAKDVISFAREMGFYQGKDEDFSFRDAYCPIDFENVRYADTRVWSFFRHHVADKTEMDQYLPYLNGDYSKYDHLPLWIKPDTLIDVRGLMNDMRDHFEGTPLDMTADMSAGPYGMPIRPLPMTFQDSIGNNYYRERPIATQQTGFTMVCQMRNWLPNDVGGIVNFNCDDANMIAYVPLYCSIRRVPEPFRAENNPMREFSDKSAFWMCNFVSNMVYPRYSAMIEDLRIAQSDLENHFQADQSEVMKRLESLSTEQRAEYLTQKSEQYASEMMQCWDRLARLLIVKHNDQAYYATDREGNFLHQPTQHRGYTPAFYDAIGKATGDRYKLKKVIVRGER